MNENQALKLDFIMKFGGSITEKGTLEQISNLGKAISEIAKQKVFTIIPGGGEFAENIRKAQKRYNFNDEKAHWMAICAMTQQAFLLSHFIPNSFVLNADHEGNYRKIGKKGMIPILDVSNFMKYKSKLHHNWENTSDAITTEIAINLGVNKIIFIKDIDGVYKNNKAIPKMTYEEILQLETTPFDEITPLLLKENKIRTIIVNGFFPERIKEIILNNNKHQQYTEVFG